MTLECRHGIAALGGVAQRGRRSAGAFLPTHCPQPRTFLPDDLSLPPAWGALAGAVLACAVPLAFCSGLIGLAVSSRFVEPVPRWLILVYGVGCVLLAWLALVLSRPWQQVQGERFGWDSATLNGRMGTSQLRKHCALDGEGMALLRAAMEGLGLSARAHDRILRVARMVADREGCAGI
jgi:hypothetical protein